MRSKWKAATETRGLCEGSGWVEESEGQAEKRRGWRRGVETSKTGSVMEEEGKQQSRTSIDATLTRTSGIKRYRCNPQPGPSPGRQG